MSHVEMQLGTQLMSQVPAQLNAQVPAQVLPLVWPLPTTVPRWAVARLVSNEVTVRSSTFKESFFMGVLRAGDG